MIKYLNSQLQNRTIDPTCSLEKNEKTSCGIMTLVDFFKTPAVSGPSSFTKPSPPWCLPSAHRQNQLGCSGIPLTENGALAGATESGRSP